MAKAEMSLGVLRERNATKKNLNRANQAQNGQVKARMGELREFLTKRQKQVSANLKPAYGQMIGKVEEVLQLECEDDERQKKEAAIIDLEAREQRKRLGLVAVGEDDFGPMAAELLDDEYVPAEELGLEPEVIE